MVRTAAKIVGMYRGQLLIYRRILALMPHVEPFSS